VVTAAERFATLIERYERWERRHITARIGGWSVRRRFLTFVVLPLTALLCCGGPVGIPVLLLARETVDAGRGSPSPVAAANEYLTALGYGQEEGLLPLLDDERQDDLLAQWRAYSAAMKATEPPPSRFDFGTLVAGAPANDRTVVRAEVEAVWWDTDENGRLGGYVSSPRTWAITTREDDGWRVSRVDAPPWCGADGYVLRCPDDPEPVPTSEPSATPSPDLLKHPREMLRCGVRDPFRELHSCPPSSPAPATPSR
jgi:hypothetical protein